MGGLLFVLIVMGFVRLNLLGGAWCIVWGRGMQQGCKDSGQNKVATKFGSLNNL